MHLASVKPAVNITRFIEIPRHWPIPLRESLRRLHGRENRFSGHKHTGLPRSCYFDTITFLFGILNGKFIPCPAIKFIAALYTRDSYIISKVVQLGLFIL